MKWGKDKSDVLQSHKREYGLETFVFIAIIVGMAAYTDAPYEGIALLPKFGELISPVTTVLFGFQDGSNIAFPITALGAVGAAIGLCSIYAGKRFSWS